MTDEPAATKEPGTSATAFSVANRKLAGPHGPLPVRIYAPVSARGPGIVWAHGGGFATGDLDMAESDHVGRVLAAHGIVTVCVGYQLAPIPSTWAARSAVEARDGVHYPVASEEVEYAFRWAAGQALTTGPWMLGGASAGGNLAAGATLRLVHTGGPFPGLLVLAYPTLHAQQSPPTPNLRAALDRDPAADRYGPEALRAMYENYLGTPLASADSSAIPGIATMAELIGMPPTVIVTADVDELRVSAEDFAHSLRGARVPVDVHAEPGSHHGFLNLPDDPATAATINRFAAMILAHSR